MSPSKFSLTLASALALLLLSCGDSHKPVNVAGSWTGTLTDSLGNSGTSSLALSQSGDVLNGTFSYETSLCQDSDNGVGGTISGMQVSLTKTPSNIYPVTLLLTMDAAGSKLSGSYSDSSGVCGSSGSIIFNKQ